MYAKIKNGQITETTDNIRRRFPNTSFPRNLPNTHEDWVRVAQTSPIVELGKRVSGSSVELVDGEPTHVYTYEDIPQEDLFRELAAARWKLETSGITLGELNIPTNDRSKLLINGAYNDALRENDPTKERTFAINDQIYIKITNEQIIQMGLVIAQHVQKCFDASEIVAEKILNYDIIDPSEIETELETAYNEIS